MKTAAYYPVHYGVEYLEASIKSIRDRVDEILILYTDVPSYGQSTSLQNPDSKDELIAIVEDHAHSFKWVDIQRTYLENSHREQYRQYLADYDLVLAVDTDEVWDNLDLAIKDAYDTKARNVGVGGDRWLHFWRSFNEVNIDGFYPIRFHNKRYSREQEIIHSGTVYHFGYAQSEALTRYKISCHGHKSIPGSWSHDKWITYERGLTSYLHPDAQEVWIETIDLDKASLPE